MRAKRKTSKQEIAARTAALVVGGLIGAAVSVLVFGDVWFWNLAIAALGAWLAYLLVERAAPGTRRRRKRGP